MCSSFNMNENEAASDAYPPTGRESFPAEKSLVNSDEVDEDYSDPALVSEVTMALPWTTWMVVLACAMWDLTISATQITCLFWSQVSAAIVASPAAGGIGGAGESIWLGQSFQVVTAVLGPVMARIGDSIGRRNIILFGVFFGMVGSIIMAVSQNIGTCIAGAALFGLSYGAGGNVFSVSSEVLPRAHRGTAQILTLYGAIAGVLVGLYVGAQLISTNPGRWRSACWFNVALHAVTFALFFVFYRPMAVENPYQLTIRKRIMQIDLTGSTLLACGITPLMVGLIWGGGVYAWSSTTVITTLVVGVAFFFVLAGHQTLIKKDGLFTSELFENSNFVLCLLTIFVEGLIYNVFTHFYGAETALLWDGTPIGLATRFSAFVYAAAIAAPLYGVWVFKTRDARNVLIFGYCSFLAGIIGMATVKVGTDKVALVYCCLCGVGFAAPLVFLNMVTQLAVKPELMGLATSLIISSRSIGGAVGVAITGAVFTAKATIKIPAYIQSAVVAAGLPAASVGQVVKGIATSNTTMVASAEGITKAIIAEGSYALRVAYADSFRYIWFVSIPFVVLGLVGLLFLKSTQHQMTAVVDRGVEDTREKVPESSV
ncbi:hypothetical protein RQP46_001838 [Phenoliferia psychrophenolica]